MFRALKIQVTLLLTPALLLAAPLFAQVPNTASDISRSSSATKTGKDKATTGKKDPVADALALPKDKPYDRLRKDQQEAYDRLKADYEPKLQAALDQKDKATKDIDKTKAAREFLKIRTEAHQKIAAILKQPDPNAKKPIPNAANHHRSSSYRTNRRY